MANEFVTTIQEMRRDGKNMEYVSYRVTIPKWLVETEGLQKGDRIRLRFEGKIRKTRTP